MPVKGFVVVVEPDGKTISAGPAIALASSYLTYADTTNTFAQSRSIYGVLTKDDDSIVEMLFQVMIENESHYQEFTDELENLAQVKEYWEASI